MGAENLAPQPGFDPRTVQLVASRYTELSRPIFISFIIQNKMIIQMYILAYILRFVWFSHTLGPLLPTVNNIYLITIDCN